MKIIFEQSEINKQKYISFPNNNIKFKKKFQKELIQLNKNFVILFQNFFKLRLNIKNNYIQLIQYQLVLKNNNHAMKQLNEINS